MSHTITDTTTEGAPTITLSAREADLHAAFAPGLGMIGCSLRHRGAELLGQRRGLAAYAQSGSTMGIPLLHPWANRLSGFGYAFDGSEVTLSPPDIYLEEHVRLVTRRPLSRKLMARSLSR